jgi:adenylate cyclase
MAAVRVDRRLAAILAADVVGYSRLVERDEAGTLERLKEHRKALIEPLIAEHQGRIVKLMGDGALCEFGSIVDAVACAIAIQRGMAEREAEVPEDQRIRFRIGINLGDVVSDEGDLYGDGVNVAARLEQLAKPGGIVISGTAYDHLQGKLGCGFENLGEQRVKNIARPVRAYQVLSEAGARPTTTNLGNMLWPRSLALTGTAVLALLATLGGGLWWNFAERVPPSPEMSAQNVASTTVAQQSASAAPRMSIVVLPFENLSGRSDQDYFADGITEDLTTDLSRIPGSFVISRNSAFTYKGRTLDVKQIGRELGVRYVLEGSVRKIGDAVRVNAQFVDAERGAHLWADRFDSNLADLAALQNEITGRIASSLNIELIEAESRRSFREQPTNPDAIDLAMRGWAVWYRPRSKENNAEARALFKQAVQLDSQSADALAGLALTHATDVGNGFSETPAEQLRLAEDALTRALAIDPDHAMGHYARGITAMMRGRIDQAMRPDRYEQAVLAFDKALASNPNLALAHLMKAKPLAISAAFKRGSLRPGEVLT